MSFDFDLNGVKIPKQTKPAVATETAPLAVAGFTIICDTREQLPYTFDGLGLVVPTVVQGLPSGDYSIDGMDELIAIERKSLDDLYGSTTWGRKRFEAEIGRLNDLPEFAAVVIEADWREIVAPAEHRPGWVNQTDPKSVTGTVNAWSIRYPRVHWLACGNRREAEIRTFQILQAAWKEWHTGK
jgi:ERCC4-type nuclease